MGMMNAPKKYPAKGRTPPNGDGREDNDHQGREDNEQHGTAAVLGRASAQGEAASGSTAGAGAVSPSRNLNSDEEEYMAGMMGAMEEFQEEEGDHDDESCDRVDGREGAYRSGTVEDDDEEEETERGRDDEGEDDDDDSGGNKKSPPSPNTCRTVRDFDGEGALRMALMQLSVSSNTEREDAPDDERDEQMELRDEWDWVLHKGDKKTSVPQSVAEEVKRLMVLNSYQILDAEREASFDRLTAMAARMYDVPIALVSLVDIGRQWFMSHHGLPPRQTPRKLAFCAHAIQSIHNILIVKDATKDRRFYDSPLVKGAPHIRFYAGAPLISPEGYKLGTFCIIDSKPWPNGLSSKEQETLHDMASMTVQIMDDRRKLQAHENTSNLKKQDPVMAAAAYDQLTPLAGLESSLEALANDESLASKLDKNQQKQLALSMESCDVLSRICHTSCQQLTENNKSSMDCTFQIPLLLKKTKSSPHVPLRDLFNTLRVVAGGIPKQVPLQMKLASSAPSHIVSDELVLTRCSLNLLSRALATTQSQQHEQTSKDRSNSERNVVSFEIFAEDGRLYFQCEYTTPRDDRSGFSCDTSSCGSTDFHGSCGSYDGEDGVNKERATSLRIFALSSQMESIGGEYGVRRRQQQQQQDGKRDSGTSYRRMSGGGGHVGYVSWFSIPVALPKRAPRTPQSRTPITATLFPGSPADVLSTETISPPTGAQLPSETPSPATVVTKSEGKSLTKTKPMEVSPTVKTSISAHEDTKTTKRKALVIEDSAIVRKCLCRGFQKLGFEVSEAGDGIAGLEALKSTHFDITLCDFVLPRIDGIECVTRYREWETKNRTAEKKQCIIGIATQANSGEIERGMASGMDAFKAKPITTNVLRELVEDLDKLKSMANQKQPTRNKRNSTNIGKDNGQEEEEHTQVSKRPKLIENDVSPLGREPKTLPVCPCEGAKNQLDDSSSSYNTRHLKS